MEKRYVKRPLWMGKKCEDICFPNEGSIKYFNNQVHRMTHSVNTSEPLFPATHHSQGQKWLLPLAYKQRMSTLTLLTNYNTGRHSQQKKKKREKTETHSLKNKKSGPGWCTSVSWTQAGNQRVASSIPSQGTCLGCGPGPWLVAHGGQPRVDVSLPFSFPSPLSKI